MSDDREVQLETTGGWQPNSSAGERILVALAAIALVGAIVIVAGNLLPEQEASRDPASTPRPTPRATPRPTPFVPAELRVVSVPSPAPLPAALFYGWIRANVDLPILSDDTQVRNQIGTLPAGAIAYAREQEREQPPDPSGWLYIDEPAPSGWVATRDGGTDLATRFDAISPAAVGAIWGLKAGPDGFLAMGTPASLGGPYPATRTYASADGVNWQAASEVSSPGCCWLTAVWGPAGWLLVGTSPESDADTWIWTSPDGLHWGPPGVIGSTAHIGRPMAIDGSELGYLLTTSFGGGGWTGTTAWYSPDGSTWIESQVGQPTNDQLRITALPIGFYAWTDAAQTSGGGSFAAFSVDGLHWVPVSGGPDSYNAQVVTVGTQVFAMESDPTTGSLRAWTGTIGGDELTWSSMQGDASFVGAAFTSLVSDGKQAVAFGWDRTTETPLTWSSTGGSWTRDELPDAFGGPATAIAAGEQGVVAVGHRWSARGDNPVIWYRTSQAGLPGGEWQAEPTPVIGLLPDPSAAECGSPPSDAIEFIALDRPTFIACFGNRPITFRTWSVRCDDCVGQPEGNSEPAWLATPMANSLGLAPIKTSGWWATAALDPALWSSPTDDMLDAWLELTGHFDDPAAQGCHRTPPSYEIPYYTGTRAVIESCRQQFVVTAVRVVEGP